MTDVLETLIRASEKAARVARSSCSGSSGDSILIAEKCGNDANTRFERDFKTIADVLAQESAKDEILSTLSGLVNNIRGEECAEIDGVSIGLQKDPTLTAELLRKLVPPETAKRMADAAHSEVRNFVGNSLPKNLPPLNPSDLGVWIDPIDATAEFIAGVRGEATSGHGLQCVTVLIGAYFKSTGEPVIGVINQPFYDNDKGRIIWGVSYGDTHIWSGSNENSNQSNIVLMSGAEKSEISEKLKESWNVTSVPGAGHKLMKVALGEAAAYIVSQGTTFCWDTCAPHAILRARGGDIITYGNCSPVIYNYTENLDTKEYCNSDGIIAYVDREIFNKIKTIIGKE